MEAWADALLEQHRTAPKTGGPPARRPTEHDRMAALMAEAGVAPAPDLGLQRPVPADPDAWVGKAQTMGAVLAVVLLLGLVLAIAAG